MSSNERGTAAADRTVLLRIRRMTQRHTARWQERIPELTKPQYAVLRALSREPEGLTQAAVAERTAIDKATLAQLIPRLEARGLALRDVAITDRRQRMLKLTAEGCELVGVVTPRAEELDRETLSPLTAHEHAELTRLLDKLGNGE
jgi:DNA-binding MarR family transcriptional regulator